ncbi:MAG TPA: response regulator transcription factor [Candidatus Acidoferrales bacterium]|nr:response regulator transcription factor [Candidatus Acidoferrales bacterium]
MSKRFLIADDNHAARRVMAEILTSYPGWSVCAEAADGFSAVELALTQRPELIILDVQMPRMNGIEAAQRILEALPDALILLISFHEAKLIVPEIKGTKIRGFVSKGMLGRDLISGVETVFSGGYYFDGELTSIPTSSPASLPSSQPASHEDARENPGKFDPGN